MQGARFANTNRARCGCPSHTIVKSQPCTMPCARSILIYLLSHPNQKLTRCENTEKLYINEQKTYEWVYCESKSYGQRPENSIERMTWMRYPCKSMGRDLSRGRGEGEARREVAGIRRNNTKLRRQRTRCTLSRGARDRSSPYMSQQRRPAVSRPMAEPSWPPLDSLHGQQQTFVPTPPVALGEQQTDTGLPHIEKKQKRRTPLNPVEKDRDLEHR